MELMSISWSPHDRRAPSTCEGQPNLTSDETLGGEPDLAKLPSFLFGRATPDPGFLIRGKRKLQAIALSRASRTDTARMIDRLESIAGASDREEQVRTRVPTTRSVAPCVAVPFMCPNPSQCHEASAYDRLGAHE